MYKHLSMFIKILCVFFVLKRFYLTFKVVHVHESVSYVILYIFACCIYCLHVYCVLAALFVCMVVLDTLYLCLYLCLQATQ